METTNKELINNLPTTEVITFVIPNEERHEQMKPNQELLFIVKYILSSTWFKMD